MPWWGVEKAKMFCLLAKSRLKHPWLRPVSFSTGVCLWGSLGVYRNSRTSLLGPVDPAPNI
jgi:hypothetical protein